MYSTVTTHDIESLSFRFRIVAAHALGVQPITTTTKERDRSGARVERCVTEDRMVWVLIVEGLPRRKGLLDLPEMVEDAFERLHPRSLRFVLRQHLSVLKAAALAVPKGITSLAG